MDENTRFLIERMDSRFDRLEKKIDSLQAFENKAYGIAILAGAVGSVMIDFLLKHLT